VKIFLTLFVSLLLLSSCAEDKETLEEGFEWVANDGRSHFIYVSEDHLNDKVAQRNNSKVIYL